MSDETGIRRGLTNYGDKDFAQYLRNSFARSIRISREMLAKPIVGIAMTHSSFKNCHRAMPQPIDSVVLIGGCDKTAPVQIMGAISAGIPDVQLVTGPMSTGRHSGERLGACTDCRRFWAKYRAGEVDAAAVATVEGRLATTAGTCAVMGTA